MAAIRYKGIFLFLILVLACFAGLRWWSPRETAPEAAPTVPELAVASACEQIRFEGTQFTACRYEPRRHALELMLGDERGPFRNFAELEQHLGDRTASLRFAMNAGMFDEAGAPIGLYVEDGRQRRALNRRAGGGNFHLAPNGVFLVEPNGKPQVLTSDAYARRKAAPRWATQSGPMLVIDGALHPAFQPNGTSLYIRNGVGVDDAGTAWFALSEEPVSFGRFARFFRDRLGTPNALYLDGSVSSLWDRPAGRQDAFPALGPMVAVFERE